MAQALAVAHVPLNMEHVHASVEDGARMCTAWHRSAGCCLKRLLPCAAALLERPPPSGPRITRTSRHQAGAVPGSTPSSRPQPSGCARPKGGGAHRALPAAPVPLLLQDGGWVSCGGPAAMLAMLAFLLLRDR